MAFLINLPKQIQFEEHTVRIQVDDLSQPWFNANDVCAALELGNPSQAIKSHVDDKDLQKRDTITAGGRQLLNYVNESGLYSLIFGSTKDAAKRFKRWVTHEVLPSIRKTGSYSVPRLASDATQDRVDAILAIGAAIAKMPGVKQEMVEEATLACIEENTGITTKMLRRMQEAVKHEKGTRTTGTLGVLLKMKKEVLQ